MIFVRLLEGQNEGAYNGGSHCQVNPTNQMMRKTSTEEDVIGGKKLRRNPRTVRRRRKSRRRRRNLQRTLRQRKKDTNDTRAAALAMMKVTINTRKKTRNIASVTMAVNHQTVIVTAQQTVTTPVTAPAALIVKRNRMLWTRKHQQVSGHSVRVTCYNQPLKCRR